MRTEALGSLRSRLRQQAVEHGFNPRDVDVLLGDILGRSQSYLISHGEEIVDAGEIEGLITRRIGGEPLQYIRRRAEFYSREFYVDDRVLIPRPETEILVEAAIRIAPRGATVVDVGTGSGCIAISLERERLDLRVVGIDRSLDALVVAAMNRQRLQSMVMLAASDNLTAVGRFDFVVANPPYIPLHEYDALSDDVRLHEPRQALTPGPLGTEAMERILAQAGRARVLLEIGFGQEASIRELAGRSGFTVDQIIPDLAAIPRVVVLSPRHDG
jgi:release factor glutamine methyltransferase